MIGSIVAGGLGALGSVASALINRNAAKQNTKLAAELEWKYYKKQRELDLAYDRGAYFDLDKAYADYNYELSKRYAENSSKWMVQGLRNANLNPILAATDGNFRGTFGEQVSRGGSNSGSAAVHASPPKWEMDNISSSALDAARNYNQTQNIEQNTETQESQEELNRETAAKVRADTAKTVVETANSAKNGGYTSFASQLFNTAKNTLFGVGGDNVSLPSLINSTSERLKKYMRQSHNIVPASKRQMEEFRKQAHQDLTRPASKTFRDVTGYGKPRKIVPRRGNTFFQSR